MSVDRIASRANPLVAAVLRSPLHGLLSWGLLLLTYRGRASGRRISLPVGYQRDGDVLTVLVSEARRKRWWRNFREPADVELRLRGRTRRGRARLLEPGSAAFCASVETTLRRVPGMSRVLGVAPGRRTGLGAAELAHLAREVAVVRIDLGPG